MAAAQLCLETDVIIDYLRGHKDVLEVALSRFDCALTAVTLYELEIGLGRSLKQKALFDDLASIVTVLALNDAAARAAAQIYHQLSAQGLPIGMPDTLIAGTCIAHEVPLLTRNVEHYKRINGLAVIQVDEL